MSDVLAGLDVYVLDVRYGTAGPESVAAEEDVLKAGLLVVEV